MRKILHLENKTTDSHKYYGSLVALCNDNQELPKHTLKRLKFEIPWENDNFKIRLGSLLTPSDVRLVKITDNDRALRRLGGLRNENLILTNK